jgi:hypothetical protein
MLIKGVPEWAKNGVKQRDNSEFEANDSSISALASSWRSQNTRNYCVWINRAATAIENKDLDYDNMRLPFTRPASAILISDADEARSLECCSQRTSSWVEPGAPPRSG